LDLEHEGKNWESKLGGAQGKARRMERLSKRNRHETHTVQPKSEGNARTRGMHCDSARGMWERKGEKITLETRQQGGLHARRGLKENQTIAENRKNRESMNMTRGGGRKKKAQKLTDSPGKKGGSRTCLPSKTKSEGEGDAGWTGEPTDPSREKIMLREGEF